MPFQGLMGNLADPLGSSSFQSTSGYQNMQGNVATTQNTAQENTYDPSAVALRGQLGGMMSKVLSEGKLPGQFGGMFDQAFDALSSHFKRNIQPVMAAQHGVGSPAIGSEFALMSQQLAAQLGREQWQNALGLFNEIGQFSYQPTGQKMSFDATQKTDQSQNYAAQSNDSWLMALPTTIRGLF